MASVIHDDESLLVAEEGRETQAYIEARLQFRTGADTASPGDFPALIRL